MFDVSSNTASVASAAKLFTGAGVTGVSEELWPAGWSSHKNGSTNCSFTCSMWHVSAKVLAANSRLLELIVHNSNDIFKEVFGQTELQIDFTKDTCFCPALCEAHAGNPCDKKNCNSFNVFFMRCHMH